MISKCILNLIFLLQFSFLPQRQIRLIYGLSRNCDMLNLDTRILRPEFFKCIEYHRDRQTFRSLVEQSKVVCFQLTKEMIETPSIFDNGMYLIGGSLGGLVARYVYQNCEEVAPYIKRIYLIGTPNLGISDFNGMNRGKSREEYFNSLDRYSDATSNR